MAQRPTITGPAAALFDEPQIGIDETLFDPALQSQDQMKMQILETRINEIYDCLLASDIRFVNLLPINKLHRHPLSNGLHAQDTSRIPDRGVIKK